tara:strand:+ start:1962 stop:2543 length:582 start_codon:yes stop_codon:yes gene_type:complete
MSFVVLKKEPQLQEARAPQVEQAHQSAGLSMKIDVVPIPVSSEEVDLSLKAAQNATIRSIKQQGKDLFQSNQTIMTTSAGKRLYQTADLYGQVLAVEDLIPQLTAADLTLRLTAERHGTHAHGTCMELKTGILADLLEDTPDAKNEKITEVSLPSSDEVGRMFVGVKMSGGKHYIQKVDYEVASAVDDQLHLH